MSPAPVPEAIANPVGGYRFLPDIRAFSLGVVADREHEIVRVRPRERVPVDRLPELLRAVVEGAYHRPRAALCSVELRCPEPMSFEAFDDFNHGYAAMLDDLGITLDGLNPVARTNVAPLLEPPAEIAVHALAFTVPRNQSKHTTFVVAGAAELDGEGENDILRPGETADDAVREKADFVLARILERAQALEVRPDRLTSANVYVAAPPSRELSQAIAQAVAHDASSFRLHLARPPITGLDFEMDMRKVASETAA